MNWHVYILKSLKDGSHYVGSASNVNIRLKRHNSGKVRSTKRGVPWEVVYTEKYLTQQEAYRRERQIKSYHGGKAFKKLLH
ncbi:MAG: GIY-YIG nuclease family protein [Patescibacteria group bacterium]|nr:GIY-YIG nuclease family protein [Patescibacteria group bacterium]